MQQRHPRMTQEFAAVYAQAIVLTTGKDHYIADRHLPIINALLTKSKVHYSDAVVAKVKEIFLAVNTNIPSKHMPEYNSIKTRLFNPS